MEQPPPEPKRRRSQRLQQQAAATAGPSRGPTSGPAAAPAQTPQTTPAVTASDDDGSSTRCCPFARILLPELLQRIAGFMDRNEVACSLRLVCTAAAAALAGPEHTTVRLSEPSPSAAFARKWGDLDALRSLTRKQREQLEQLTARSGSIANLQALAARGDLPRLSRPPDDWWPLLKVAARWGRLELCSWLRQQGAPVSSLSSLAAAESGELAVVQFLVDARTLYHMCFAANAAARHGHVHVLDWLLGRLQPGADFAYILKGVAHGCTLDVLQRLYAQSTALQQLRPSAHSDCLVAAAGSPTSDWRGKVEWLEGLGGARSNDACEAAACEPDALARLQWLVGRGYALDTHVAYTAAEAGNAEALRYVLTQGVVLEPSHAQIAMTYAARRGHLVAIEVLHAAGTAVDRRVVEAAAEGGHLPVVAWAGEQQGFALTACLFRAAALSGSWPLLRWLHERGCPRDASVFAAAAAGGCSKEQLEWLVERGCPMGDDGAAYTSAVSAGDLFVLGCLRRLGCPFAADGGTFTAAVEAMRQCNEFEFAARLLWLLDAGCPVDWAAVMGAAGDASGLKLWLANQCRQRGGGLWQGRLRPRGRSAAR